MPRNRIIYQSEVLYCGPSPATGFHFKSGASNRVGATLAGDLGSGMASGLVQQLHRVQDISYNFSVDRTDVNQFGELAAIDRVVLTPPTVSLDFSYLLNSFSNEKLLGLTVDTSGNVSAIKNLLNKTSDERNYFIKTVGEGVDAIGEGNTASDVISIGNGFLTNYGVEASVGSFPSVKISVEGLNMAFETGLATGTFFTLPSVNPENGTRSSNKYILPIATGNAGPGDLDISVLRPGDITFSIKRRDASSEGYLTAATGAYTTPGQNLDDNADRKIQSFNIGLSLKRSPISKLGSRYAFSREIDFPVQVTSTIEALVTDLTTGSLTDLVNFDEAYDLSMNINKPGEGGAASSGTAVRYMLRNCKVTSQAYKSSIGANKMVTIDFTSQIGGPNQTTVGLFMSGVTSDLASVVNNDIKIAGSTVQ